jgi:hypothetical protein
MKEFRLEENLGHLTLEQFFELFFEGDTFSYQWHEKRGNTGTAPLASSRLPRPLPPGANLMPFHFILILPDFRPISSN